MLPLPGTLGQEMQWRLGDASTYQHPLSPMDILLDPLSVPDVKPLQHASQLEEAKKSPKQQQQQQQWAVKQKQFGGNVLDVESEEEEASTSPDVHAL